MKINIIGRGNVATHLQKAFADKATVNLVNPHTFDTFDPDAEVSLISVSDNAIADVAAAIPLTTGIIAHTSGSTPIDVLKSRSEKTGVFYPLQTFTKDSTLQYSTIPFFIEGSDTDTERRLIELAAMISNNVSTADSEKRKALHVASVFACNFANHMWTIAEKILKKNGMSYDVILPLLSETLRKTKILSPFDAQTGPAVRQDSNTLDAHIKFLETDKELCNLYSLLSSSIISSHMKEQNKSDNYERH